MVQMVMMTASQVRNNLAHSIIMKLKKNILSLAVALLCGTVSLNISSCSDDIPADKYYTFTGEMMSDYLKSNAQYSQFVKIVDRAADSQRGVSIMDLISVYGQYTCFAPDNDAVDAFLKANGYSNVSEIPVDICDTIARTHLLNGRIFETTEFRGISSLRSVNMNGRYLQVQQGFVYKDADSVVYTTDSAEVAGKDDVHTTYRLNRSGFIRFDAANDSVENGIVHTVTSVITSSNQSVSNLLDENPNVSLFSQAMNLTGISEMLSSRVKDETWNPDLWESQSVYTGAQHDYCHVPETKNYGFTVFACPDDVLESKYNITDMQSFYNYAQGIYGGEDLDVTDPENAAKLRSKDNPLRRLIAYNILNTKGMYEDLTINIMTAKAEINPTTWYGTMDSLTTIKAERLTVSRYIQHENDVRNDLYLNRGDFSRGDYQPGVHVNREVGDEFENEGLNGVYYTTDGLADFGEHTKQTIFNTRMRVDLYYLFPELMTNSIRDGKSNNKIGDSNNPDKTVTSPNYWFPKGYLDNVKVNDDGIFLFQSQHQTYWSYEGDEFNLASMSGSYDVEFNLPTVPSGTYQIRLGFTAMPTRGICQFYLDGEPQGIPFDMRSDNFVTRTGWFKLTESGYTGDDLETAKKNMHNLGWYHGPRGAFRYDSETLGYDQIKDQLPTSGNRFCNIDGGGGGYIVRYVLTTANLDEREQHRLRVRSIWAPEDAVVMIDYIELVPKSVYGIEGEGKAEDDY